MVNYTEYIAKQEWLGFVSTTDAHIGPRTAQVDVSNPCNLGCVCCWTYSPRVMKPNADLLRRRVSIELFQQLVEDLAELETSRICFAGVGDPLTHPEIDRMIEFVKDVGLQVNVTTSGTLLHQGRLERWVKCGMDWLSVSVLGATEAVWQRMHPRDDPRLYARLVESLEQLRELRQFYATASPGLGLSHVLCKLSATDIEDAVQMAADVAADNVSFYDMQSFPEVADLKLGPADFPQLLSAVKRGLACAADLNVNSNLENLLATLSADGHAARRVMPRIPCYHGWVFTRILADGNVFPCCGAVGRSQPIGNIHEQRFRDIWTGSAYSDFRRRSKNLWDRGNAGFRRTMGCESCPDIDVNMKCHEEALVFEGSDSP